MPEQLKMWWPEEKSTPTYFLPKDHHLRHFNKGDKEKFLALLNEGTDLGLWDDDKLKESILSNKLSPQGVFLIEYENSIVATASAYDRSSPQNEKTSELGWVKVSENHRGKGLGFIVCAEVIDFLLANGYKKIFLRTDHWRKAAVKTYLKLGFEPDINDASSGFLWKELREDLQWKKITTRFCKPYAYGAETAFLNLMREKTKEPCIIASWCMKREFFSYLSSDKDIYKNAPQTVIRAFIRAGANLCPQFIMPSPITEHLAANPFLIKDHHTHPREPKKINSPEDLRDHIESLPDPDTLEDKFNYDQACESYAKGLLKLSELAKGEMLFIESFGQADFMGGYTNWGYDNYLMAIALYPEHMKRYFDFSGEQGRLYNLAIVEAVKRYSLAPFVYGGQDICFNDGPIISLESLKKLYFPALKRAVSPLHEAGIKIIWHCDGDVRLLTETLLTDIGVSGFQGFQEETGCTLAHMASLKTNNGEKPLLWGSISVTSTLPFGSKDEIKKDVERCFDTAGPLGFALASTSSILPETPLENILAMYEHGSFYGKQKLQDV